MEKITLAIDYGTSVTGLALFHPNQDPWPLPYGRIIYRSDHQLIQDIEQKIEEESVEIIVLGLPLCKDGGKSPMTKKVEAFGKALQQKLSQGVALYYQNEHLTTFEAEDRMKSSPRYNFTVDSKQIDALSACIILEEFLMEKC